MKSSIKLNVSRQTKESKSNAIEPRSVWLSRSLSLSLSPCPSLTLSLSPSLSVGVYSEKVENKLKLRGDPRGRRNSWNKASSTISQYLKPVSKTQHHQSKTKPEDNQTTKLAFLKKAKESFCHHQNECVAVRAHPPGRSTRNKNDVRLELAYTRNWEHGFTHRWVRIIVSLWRLPHASHLVH